MSTRVLYPETIEYVHHMFVIRECDCSSVYERIKVFLRVLGQRHLLHYPCNDWSRPLWLKICLDIHWLPHSWIDIIKKMLSLHHALIWRCIIGSRTCMKRALLLLISWWNGVPYSRLGSSLPFSVFLHWFLTLWPHDDVKSCHILLVYLFSKNVGLQLRTLNVFLRFYDGQWVSVFFRNLARDLLRRLWYNWAWSSPHILNQFRICNAGRLIALFPFMALKIMLWVILHRPLWP